MRITKRFSPAFRYGFAFLTMPVLMSVSYADPVLSGVTAGDATVTQSSGSTRIDQTSQQAILDWHSFNVGKDEAVHFQQPVGGVALNRIDASQGASQIFGRISATGKIILVNGAGIYFGPSAMVNVGSLIASNTGISAKNFLAGHYIFDQATAFNGAIVNHGSIHAADYGLVALLGNTVENHGLIQAQLGTIALGSGNAFTLDFNGDQLINFKVDAPATAHASITNRGSLLADGGRILVSANAAQGVLDSVINMDGTAQAHSLSEQNGEIILDGGDAGTVTVTGSIDVTGKHTGSTGGSVKVLGNAIDLEGTANIDASGDMGGGQILVGGNYQGKGPERNAHLTYADTGSILKADALRFGNGGKVIFWGDDAALFHGNISVQGGNLGGNGGFIETSGHYLDVAHANISTIAKFGQNGNWLLDPADITISNAPTSNPAPFNPNYVADNNSTVSTVNVTDLTNALATGNVTIQTTAGGAGLGSGNITVAAPVAWSSSSLLTLRSINNIFLNAAITTGTSLSSLVLDLLGTATQTAVIGGLGRLIIQNGVVVLSQANTYSGDTVLSGGTLQASAANVFSAASRLTISSGTTVNLNNFNNTIKSLTGASGSSVTLGNARLTVQDTSPAGFAATYSGVISGSGGITINSTGSTNSFQILAGANTYAGATIINSGNLQIGLGGTTGSISAASAIQNNGTLIFNRSDNITVPNLISGTGGLNKFGSAVITLSNSANSYSGLTFVIAGTLQAGAVNAFSANSAVSIAAGATLDLNNFNNTIITLNSPTGTFVTLGSGTLTVQNAVANSTSIFRGVISGTGGLTVNLTGTGDDYLILLGANTYTGLTRINAGILQIGGGGAVGSISASTPIIDNGNLTFFKSGNYDVLNTISGTGTLEYAGTGTTNITGNNAYTGTTQIDSGRNIVVQTNSALGTNATMVLSGASLALANGITLANNLVLNGTGISSGGALTGTGTSTVTGAITLGSDSSISAVSASDTLNLNGAINGASALTLQGSGRFNLGGAIGNTTALASVSASNLAGLNLSGGSIRTTGNQTYNTAVTLGSNMTLSALNNGNISFTQGVSGATRDLSLLGGTGNNTYSLGGAIDVNALSLVGGSGNNNTLDFANFSSPFSATLLSDHAGTLLNTGANPASFTNFQAIVANNSGTITLANTTKVNSIVVTGPTQATINDPVAISGFSTIIAPSNTQVTFANPSTVTFINGVPYINNVPLFVFSNDSGTLTPFVFTESLSAQTQSGIVQALNSANQSAESLAASGDSSSSSEEVKTVAASISSLEQQMQQTDTAVAAEQKIQENC
jgi:filamentous hemagglutinin family protein